MYVARGRKTDLFFLLYEPNNLGRRYFLGEHEKGISVLFGPIGHVIFDVLVLG